MPCSTQPCSAPPLKGAAGLTPLAAGEGCRVSLNTLPLTTLHFHLLDVTQQQPHECTPPADSRIFLPAISYIPDASAHAIQDR